MLPQPATKTKVLTLEQLRWLKTLHFQEAVKSKGGVLVVGGGVCVFLFQRGSLKGNVNLFWIAWMFTLLLSLDALLQLPGLHGNSCSHWEQGKTVDFPSQGRLKGKHDVEIESSGGSRQQRCSKVKNLM